MVCLRGILVRFELLYGQLKATEGRRAKLRRDPVGDRRPRSEYTKWDLSTTPMLLGLRQDRLGETVWGQCKLLRADLWHSFELNGD